MNLLELQLFTPAEQLAADEWLLDQCEAGQRDETLRFWEPRETFVVVGYANKAATEVNLPACTAASIPVFRRCSGGGTIVQLPGGLNYSLVLRVAENTPTRNISAANQFIMEKNGAAIQALVPDAKISVRGHTDLVLERPAEAGRKFAGNSQRRCRHFLLFHGTFLLACNLNRISELLRMPSLQPDYRTNRPHTEFVTNLALPAEKVKAALAEAWNATAKSLAPPLDGIQKLAREKYSTRDWNFKF